MRAPEGQLILRAGARLMYSFARKGFPSRVLRVGRFVNRFGRAGALVPIFCTGEIDVRVHLPKHLDASMDWVEAYVARCMELAGLLKPDKVGFFVPTPPVDVPEEDVWFPITGTISERVEAHRKLRHALAAAVGADPERRCCSTSLISLPVREAGCHWSRRRTAPTPIVQQWRGSAPGSLTIGYSPTEAGAFTRSCASRRRSRRCR